MWFVYAIFKRKNAKKRLHRSVSELDYIFNYVPTNFILHILHLFSQIFVMRLCSELGKYKSQSEYPYKNKQ